jgi:hypothetical protein
MKLTMRATALGKKITLISTAFILTVSTFTVAVPLILSQNASAVASPYTQGFEWGTSDWTNATIVSDGADYGVTSSEGTHYAQVSSGAYTKWGSEYRSAFPVGGYSTSIDLFLRMDTAQNGAQEQVDYSSAINNQAGTHRRDFIFHVGTDATVNNQWFVSASNNSPGNPLAENKATISQDGWYVLKHDFKNVDGVLAVTLSVTQKSTGTVLGSWTLSDPSDVIATEIGGNRYGWFTGNPFTIPYVAVDNALLTVNNAPQPTAPQNGATQYSNGSSTFGWDAVPGADSYEVRYSQGPSRTPNNVDGQLDAVLGTATTATTSTTVNDLPGGWLFWQVRGIFAGQAGPWSNIWTTDIANSETVTVTEFDSHGWEFNGDRTGDVNWTRGEGSYVDGPASAPLGDGSARITADASSDREKLRKYIDAGTNLTDITDLTYSTYRTATSTGSATALALQLDVNFTATPTNPARADARVVFDPYMVSGTVLNDTWQTWNTLDAANDGWFIAGASVATCTQSVPCTWGQLLAAYPTIQTSAKSLEPTTDTQAAVQFKAGGWPAITWFDGSVDAFVFGIREDGVTTKTTYDFEPIHNTAPTVSFVAPTPAEGSAVSGSVTGSVLATDDYGMGSYYIRFWKGAFESGIENLIGNCQSAPGAFLLGTNVATECSLDTTSLPEGTVIVLSAQFLDGHNAWGSSLRSFVVDNEAPVVTITATEENTNTPTITGTVDDPTAIVTITIEGSAPATATNNGDGTWKYTVPVALDDAEYAVLVTAKDPAGNDAEPKFALLLIDTTVPEEDDDEETNDNDDGGETPAPTPSPTPTPTPVATVTPTITGPTAFIAILGANTTDGTDNDADATDDTSGTPEVEGIETANTLAAAVDANNTDGKALGLAWYWWLLIAAGVAMILWWIIAAARRRQSDDI